MASYHCLQEETRAFGKNSYVEVSRKRLVEAGGEQGDFLLVSRGFFDREGTKTWTRFVTIPDDPKVRAWLRDVLARL